ncbi:MAG: M48 family metalloprotease, partial [Planctomycetota bacterium]
SSFICAPTGEVLAQAGRDSTEVITATLEPDVMARWRGLFLFALGSLAVVLLLKDAAVLTLAAFGIELSAGVQSFVFLGASLSIFILSPRLLVLLLPTWSLSEEARQRLKLVSDTAMLREPLVRVWNTHGSVMNAFAIGFIPRLRCVLLSDALLQNLRAEEIEAVYAHELGHMRHRHVAWYLLFFVTLLLLFSGPFFYVASMLFPANLDAVAIAWYWRVLDVTLSVGVIAGVLLGFGWLSRRFEREADVFAASTMQRRIDELADMPVSKGPGMLGASLFSQALYSAAGGVGPPRITGPGAWRKHLRRWRDWPRTISSSFLHGSVRDRATFLQHVASKPADLEHFRRRMFVLRIAMVATCVGSAMFLALS